MSITYITKVFPTYDRFTGKRAANKGFRKVECVKVHIDGKLFATCKDIDRRGDMSYRDRTDTAYRRGFFRENGLVGFLGEAAASLVFGVAVDWTPKIRGDGGFDLILGGKRTDVKTARSPKNQRNYITRVQYYGSEREYKRELKAEMYVGGYIEDDHTLDNGWCNVILIGYISREELEDQPLRRSPVQNSNHFNTEMYFSTLAPIRGFLKYHEYFVQTQRKPEPVYIQEATSPPTRVWCFISPEGETVSTTNLAQFCREKDLQPSHMTKVSRGKRPHHKGWKAYRGTVLCS